MAEGRGEVRLGAGRIRELWPSTFSSPAASFPASAKASPRPAWAACCATAGFGVTMTKLDPYINVDAGTMNPYQHGEVFVTDDGAETDLDLGHYERFVDINLTPRVHRHHRRRLLAGHRQGAARRLSGRHRADDPAHHQRDQGARPAGRREDSGADVVIAEVGGTVGDIEGLPFLEAIRQFRKDVGTRTCCMSTSR